jgi:hypothetical protein
MSEPSLPIVGIGGLKESGKDAFASRLVRAHGYRIRGMSNVLDEMLLAVNPHIVIREGEPAFDIPTGADVEGRTAAVVQYRDLRAYISYDESKKIRDVRERLQGLGTEGGRELIDEQVWVDLAKQSAGRIADRNWDEGYPTVITGIRYPNEWEMIQKRNGVLIWVDRPEITERHRIAQAKGDSTALHSSENTLTADDFDIVITNDHDLEHLYDEADVFVSEARGAQQSLEFLARALTNYDPEDI